MEQAEAGMRNRSRVKDRFMEEGWVDFRLFGWRDLVSKSQSGWTALISGWRSSRKGWIMEFGSDKAVYWLGLGSDRWLGAWRLARMEDSFTVPFWPKVSSSSSSRKRPFICFSQAWPLFWVTSFSAYSPVTNRQAAIHRICSLLPLSFKKAKITKRTLQKKKSNKTKNNAMRDTHQKKIPISPRRFMLVLFHHHPYGPTKQKQRTNK